MCRTLISHKFSQNTDHHGNFICIYLGARVKIVFILELTFTHGIHSSLNAVQTSLPYLTYMICTAN